MDLSWRNSAYLDRDKYPVTGIDTVDMMVRRSGSFSCPIVMEGRHLDLRTDVEAEDEDSILFRTQEIAAVSRRHRVLY